MDFLADISKELQSLDPIDFVENYLTVKGKSFKLRNCGRDYLFEIYRYIVFEAAKPSGIPVIVVKGRQVEMSTTAMALGAYFMASGLYDHITGLHAFPLIKSAGRFSVKQFDTLVQESVQEYLYKRRAGIKVVGDKCVTDHTILNATWNQTQKDFKGANTLYIEGAGADGDRLRGMQIDFILYDEFQDWARDAVAVIKESLSHSVLGPSGTGVELFFGTPKDAGSEFHEKWNASDQRYYHLKCAECGHFQRLTLENFHHGYMVKCNSCSKLFDKRIGIASGKWIASKPENSKKMRGYHVDQLLVPTITKEAIDRKLEDNSVRTNQNEVLGNFYSGSIDELTLAKVMDWTTTHPDSRRLTFAPFLDGIETVMGIDWGGRISGEEDPGEGSYTVVTILSRTFEGKYKLEYAEKMPTNKLEDLIKQISVLIRKYGCIQVFADHGYGADKIDRLRDTWKDSVKAVYTGGANLKKGYSYNDETQMVTIDKHLALEEMVSFMQQYNFIFPCGDEEKVDWLWEHISGVEIFTVDQGGMLRKKFKKKRSTQPIDGLMSLLYAFTGQRFLATDGFTSMGSSGRRTHGKGNMPKPLVTGGSGFNGVMGQRHRRQRNT